MLIFHERCKKKKIELEAAYAGNEIYQLILPLKI